MEKTMINAECHSGDFAVEVNFDATKWFEQATDKAIVDLIDCGWGGDYPADDVAMFMADDNQTIEDMFKYLELRNPIDCFGFECNVNPDDAMTWLKNNRPEIDLTEQ
jgi:hypothetical protein